MVEVLNPNLVLIGYMGTGKTTIGRLCARSLGFRFVDTDTSVERSAKRSIRDIFAESGEGEFRRMERHAVRKAAAHVHVVIATGGGAVLDAANVEELRRSGVIIWLCVEPEEIHRRCRDRSLRPLLADAEDPMERIRNMLAERAPYYEAAADAAVHTTGLKHEDSAHLVLKTYRSLAAQWPALRREAG